MLEVRDRTADLLDSISLADPIDAVPSFIDAMGPAVNRETMRQ
jgi:hypothetical protein